jgi:ketosteroid isomerase-like protein
VTNTQETVASARAAVEAATSAFHQALRTNDAEALFEHVSDDVVLMPPGEPVLHGKSAMRDWYAAFLGQYRTTELAFADCEVHVGDEWAVELGTYEWHLDPVSGGDPVIDRGNYMQLWKALPDGQWRFEREIWNSSMPPAAPPVE